MLHVTLPAYIRYICGLMTNVNWKNMYTMLWLLYYILLVFAGGCATRSTGKARSNREIPCGEFLNCDPIEQFCDAMHGMCYDCDTVCPDQNGSLDCETYCQYFTTTSQRSSTSVILGISAHAVTDSQSHVPDWGIVVATCVCIGLLLVIGVLSWQLYTKRQTTNKDSDKKEHLIPDDIESGMPKGAEGTETKQTAGDVNEPEPRRGPVAVAGADAECARPEQPIEAEASPTAPESRSVMQEVQTSLLIIFRQSFEVVVNSFRR